MRSLTRLLLAAALAAPVGALAQGNDSSTQSSLSEKQAPGGGQGGRKAHVGAGTTDATTSGQSGPKSASSGPPPPPDATLCDDYRDTPAHAGCLAVTLRQETRKP